MTRELLPSIVEYAELGEFIDAPLKTYSSGMRARLGFAIATSVDPDILLLDEVLATGDANFRAKSKARVIEIVGAAKAVVLVTHDMNWVTEYCNRAMLIEKGQMVMEGDPAEVVELHRVHTEEARARADRGRAGGRRRPEDRPDPLRPSGAAISGPGSGAPGQRRRRTAATTPTTAPNASAPRQSSRTRTSPSTWRAMTTPANARPPEGDPAGGEAPHGGLVELDVAREHGPDEGLVDPRLAGDGDPDRRSSRPRRDRPGRSRCHPC